MAVKLAGNRTDSRVPAHNRAVIPRRRAPICVQVAGVTVFL